MLGVAILVALAFLIGGGMLYGTESGRPYGIGCIIIGGVIFILIGLYLHEKSKPTPLDPTPKVVKSVPAQKVR